MRYALLAVVARRVSFDANRCLALLWFVICRCSCSLLLFVGVAASTCRCSLSVECCMLLFVVWSCVVVACWPVHVVVCFEVAVLFVV